ncbi:MAG: porin family protein [Chitinophagales bacterium]
MKRKSIYLSLLLGIFSVIMVHGQGFHIGAKGGVNMNKIAGRSFTDEFDYGYSLGGFVDLDFSKKWGLQPELMWSQSKTKTATNINDIYPEGITSTDVTLNYLTIPVLLTYKPIPLLSLQAGPQFGILLSQTQNFVYNVQDAFKKGDFSMLFGAQLNLGAFKAGARYFIGLNNLNDIDDADKWTNQGFQFYVGLKIF